MSRLETGQTVACLSSMATRMFLGELAALHENRTGYHVVLTAIGGVHAAGRVREGQQADVVVLAAGVMRALEAEGHLVPGSLVPVAVSGIAVAVPTGAARLDVSTEASLREAVLAGRGIGYSTGPSGDHILKVFRDWDILSQIHDRLVKAPPGVPVSRLLTDRKVALGFQQLSELVDQPGIEVLGALPDALQSMTTFTAGVATSSAQPGVARVLIETMTGPDAPAMARRYGLTAG